MKYKVGDWVRIIDDLDGYGHVIGSNHEVTYVGGGLIVSGGWCLIDKEIEPYTFPITTKQMLQPCKIGKVGIDKIGKVFMSQTDCPEDIKSAIKTLHDILEVMENV